MSYGRSRSFVAQANHQLAPQNSLRCRQSNPSSCGKRLNVEAAGTVTSRRQHLPVQREVRPEEGCVASAHPARCAFPTAAAAVPTVCPLSALLTHCITLVSQ